MAGVIEYVVEMFATAARLKRLSVRSAMEAHKDFYAPREQVGEIVVESRMGAGAFTRVPPIERLDEYKNIEHCWQGTMVSTQASEGGAPSEVLLCSRLRRAKDAAYINNEEIEIIGEIPAHRDPNRGSS